MLMKIDVKENFSATDLDILMEHTKYYMLLSRVYERKELFEDSTLHLIKAKEMQSRYIFC